MNPIFRPCRVATKPSAQQSDAPRPHAIPGNMDLVSREGCRPGAGRVLGHRGRLRDLLASGSTHSGCRAADWRRKADRVIQEILAPPRPASSQTAEMSRPRPARPAATNSSRRRRTAAPFFSDVALVIERTAALPGPYPRVAVRNSVVTAGRAARPGECRSRACRSCGRTSSRQPLPMRSPTRRCKMPSTSRQDG